MILENGQFRIVFIPNDFTASRSFYLDGLGLPMDHEWDYGGGDQGVVFIAGGGMIELLGAVPGSPYVKPQGASLLIQVDDTDRWNSLARERGLKIIQEPTSYPWGHRIVRLEDPDGLVVSLFSLVQS